MITHHRTKEGKEIALEDLETSHLSNIIAWIERKAEDGIIVRTRGGSCPEDFWADEEELFDREAKEHMNYHAYTKELKRRQTTNLHQRT